MLASLTDSACRITLILATLAFACGLAVIGQRYPIIVVLVLAILAWRKLRRPSGSVWSHGTATVATMTDLDRNGMLSGDGLILGTCLPDRPPRLAAFLGLISPSISSQMACRRFLAAFFGQGWAEGRMIRATDSIHSATYAPAGAGKGVSVLVPNLLSHRGNCVVTDPKGELYKLTAKHRSKKFGHKIIRLDPFGVRGPGSDTLNPFDFIDAKSDDFLDACRDLANMLVVRTGQEKEPHWNDSAELVLTAFIAFTCGAEPDPNHRNLQTVRGMASSRQSFAQAIKVMQQAELCQGVISRLGGLLTWFDGEELGSVLTTFQRHTAFIDSPLIARNTSTGSFDPRGLRSGKMTVYLILPADRLVSLAPLQRMWIGIIMRVITRGEPTEKNPVLWLLDEYAHIGRIQIIEDAVTLMRGMGMRLWFFFQSLDQLKTCFGEHAPTILDNLGTQQFFGINSYSTADAISQRIGETTIGINSVNDTRSDSYQKSGPAGSKDGSSSGTWSTSRSITSSDMARRVYKPEEILTLPPDVALIFHKNMPVIAARLLKYYNAPSFRWGGTGKQRGLGLAAGVMAILTLYAGLVFAGFALRLPVVQPVRPAGSYSASGNRRPTDFQPFGVPMH